MKLYLRGHDNKYAAEQMLLTLYPSERPEYPAGKPQGDRAELSRSMGAEYVTVVCRLWRDGRCYTGRAAVKREAAADPVMLDRMTQRMIKSAFYRAAVRAGRHAGADDHIDLRSGCRSGKLASRFSCFARKASAMCAPENMPVCQVAM